MSRFKTLFLVYTHGMPAQEYSFYRPVVDRIPQSVAAWSEGNAAMDPFEVVDVSRPIETFSDAGDGGRWLGPRECRAEIGGRWDSVIALWHRPDDVLVNGWGYGMAPSQEANGAGFSSCVSNHWEHASRMLNPEEGFVHEWLHQVEGALRALGVGPEVFPDLHDAGHSRSCRSAELPPFGKTYGEYHAETETWQPWYRDYMTGQVRRARGTGCYGISADAWGLVP